MGEGSILAQLVESAPPGSGVLVGAGDDAAVWQPPPGTAVVVSQDALVEGEDFRREWITPYGLGRRCVEVALSDLAAMGAVPAWCTATLCAASETAVGDVLALALGVREAGADAGCSLVGGDLSAIRGPLVVDVCVGGWIEPERVLRRDAGRPGDMLAVTGRLGAAAAGLRVLSTGRPSGVSPEHIDGWLDAQLRPRARVAEGRRLAELGVRCAGDLSDGLLVDAGRTARASGCLAELRLEALPLAGGLRRGYQDWEALALGGGEDFELLAAAPPEVLAAVMAAWPAELAPLTVVGVLREGSAGVRLLHYATVRPLPPVLSRHFA